MRGEILELSQPTKAGLILGQDGKRYNYSDTQLRSDVVLAIGQAVDFIGLGNEARDIYVVTTPLPAGASVAAAQKSTVSAGYSGSEATIAPELSLWGYFVRGITRHYVKFGGRGRRREYWGYTLFWWIFVFVAILMDIAVSLIASGFAGTALVLPLFTLLWWLGTILPNLAIVVRRLHDNGMSGWMILIRAADWIIPLAGTVVIFIITLMDSQRQTNKHGPSPKYGSELVDTFA